MTVAPGVHLVLLWLAVRCGVSVVALTLLNVLNCLQLTI